MALTLVTLGYVTYLREGAVFTYEATREVAVEPASGGPALDSPEAASRVERHAFDASLVGRLAVATQRSVDEAAAGALEVRLGIGKPGRLEISCRDADPLRASVACDEVSRTVVTTAPRALATDAGSGDQAATRVAAVRDLARFTQAHAALVTTGSALPPQEAEQWVKLWRAARDAAFMPPESSSAPTARASLIGPTLGPEPVGASPANVLLTGLLSAFGVGLVIFGLQRGGRARPATFDDDVERSRGRVSSAPSPRLTSSAPPPRPTSSAPPPRPTSSAPPPRPTSSAPPAAKASPLPPRASPLPQRPSPPPAAPSPAPPHPLAPAAPQQVSPRPAAVSPEPLFLAADAAAEAPREKAPSTILPPPDAAAGSARRTASGQLRYEATSLPASPLAPVLPTTRTTQLLGSIRPPDEPGTPPPSASSKSDGEPVAASQRPLPPSRYSFVTTPPPAGGDPVRPHDLGPDWEPDASVDPTPCRPLCRELFAFGVEHCFVIGVTCLPGVDSQKSEFASSLAVALASSGHARVLLVEADLDRPTQHRLMRAEMPPGTTLSRQLQARMTRRDVGHWSVLRASRSLHLLVDGSESTPGLILSRTFEECVRALRAYYDFIVLDGPAGSRESACCALDGVVDGLVILCTEERRAEVPQVSRFFTTKRFSKAIRATT